MKKSILILAASTFITGALVTSCNSPEEKVENAQENVAEAHQDLDKANEEYLADVETYRKATAERIAANDQSIAEFNLRLANDKQEAKEDYRKKVTELEQKNSDMRKKMDDYKVEGKDNWEIFKTEFNRDMDELGQAFKDLTVKNTK